MGKTQVIKSCQRGEPMVGIFWVDNKLKRIVLIHADPLKSLEPEPGVEFLNGPHAHFAVWELLKQEQRQYLV